MARNQNGDWLRYENPDEKLPWLEPAENYEEARGPLRGKLIGGLIAMVAVIVVLVAGMSWYLNRDTAPDGNGEAKLIQAPIEPYKTPPADPGGMMVEGQGDTVYAAGAGVDPGGIIDLSGIPEEPISRSAPGAEAGDVAVAVLPPSTAAQKAVPQAAAPAKNAQTQQAPAKAAAPAPAAATVPAKAVEAAPSRTGNGTYGLQLGAFSSKAKADSAWKALTGRFTFLGALDKSVEPVGKGDTTLYRLRAVGIVGRTSADNLCGRMKVAGDACTVVAP